MPKGRAIYSLVYDEPRVGWSVTLQCHSHHRSELNGQFIHTSEVKCIRPHGVFETENTIYEPATIP